MYERFTDRARRVIQTAKRIARDNGIGAAEPFHLLAAMLKCEETVAAHALGYCCGLTYRNLMGSDARRIGVVDVANDIPLSEPVKYIVEWSQKEADAIGDGYVGTEHLLLAMCNTSTPVSSFDDVLCEMRVGRDSVIASVMRLLDYPKRKTPVVRQSVKATGEGTAEPPMGVFVDKTAINPDKDNWAAEAGLGHWTCLTPEEEYNDRYYIEWRRRDGQRKLFDKADLLHRLRKFDEMCPMAVVAEIDKESPEAEPSRTGVEAVAVLVDAGPDESLEHAMAACLMMSAEHGLQAILRHRGVEYAIDMVVAGKLMARHVGGIESGTERLPQ